MILLLGKSTRKTRLVQWQIQILPRLKPIFWLPWHHRVVRNRGLYIQCTLQDFQELKTSITLAINSIHTWIFARSYSAKILSTNSYMYGYSTGLFQYFLFGFLTNVILNPSFGTILLRKKSNKQSTQKTACFHRTQHMERPPVETSWILNFIYVLTGTYLFVDIRKSVLPCLLGPPSSVLSPKL